MSKSQNDSQNLDDNFAREEWLSKQAEKHQNSIVNTKGPMIISPIQYFGTRRTTYSDVLSIITTIEPAMEFDVKSIQKSRKKNALFSEKVYASPLQLAEDRDYDDFERRNQALWKEKEIFINSLKQERNQRMIMENDAALVIQRLFRGYNLRKNFDKLKRRLQMKKRVRHGMKQVTHGTTIILEEKERLKLKTTIETKACIAIQNRYRMILAQRYYQKEKRMQMEEKQNFQVTIIQAFIKRLLAQRMIEKRRIRQYKQDRYDGAILFQSLYRSYQSRKYVTHLRMELEIMAVFMIQNQYRLYLSRKVLKHEKQRQHEVLVNGAAIDIQRIYRGKIERRYVFSLRQIEKQLIQQACALSIQRIFRGNLGRRILRLEKYRQLDEKYLIRALFCQKIVRGFLSRRFVFNLHEKYKQDIFIQSRLGNEEIVEDLFHGFNTEKKYTKEDMDKKGNTIFLISCRYGHKGLARKCLRWGFNIDHENNIGESAIFLATHYGYVDLVLYLISKKAKVNLYGRTLLHEACRNGLMELIDPLLLHGIDINERDEQERTALHEAINSHHYETISCLLKQKAKVNLQQEDGQTPLHLVASYGDIKIIHLLLEYHADISLIDHRKRTPWRIALSNGYGECAIVLRKHFMEINGNIEDDDHFELNDQQKEELFLAISNGNIEYVNNKLDEGLTIDYTEMNNGNTLLIMACKSGQLKMVEYLIKRGANLNQENFYGRTALMESVKHEKICYLLIEEGANLFHMDCHQRTILHEAACEGFTFSEIISSYKDYNINLKDDQGLTPLHEACKLCNESLCKKFFHLGAQGNVMDNKGRTPLHYCASSSKDKYCLSILIQYGCNVDQVDFDGRTCLHEACLIGNYDGIQYLIQQKGNNIHALDNKKRSPLFDAEFNGDVEIMNLLIQYGGNVLIQDINGNSLLHEAILHQHDLMIDLFISQKIQLIDCINQFHETPGHIASRIGYEYGLNTILHHIHDDEVNAYLLKKTLQNDTIIKLILSNGHEKLFHLIRPYFKEEEKNIMDENGYTLLHYACESIHPSIILLETLIGLGCSVNTYTKKGYQPLHLIASFSESSNALSFLLKKGASIDSPAKLTGKTALHCAAEKGNKSCCETLLSMGANKNLLYGDDGITCAQLALKNGFHSINELIQSYKSINR